MGLQAGGEADLVSQVERVRSTSQSVHGLATIHAKTLQLAAPFVTYLGVAKAIEQLSSVVQLQGWWGCWE